CARDGYDGYLAYW
nr:immunoglobulin heavy chain junction region [Mus musculus]